MAAVGFNRVGGSLTPAAVRSLTPPARRPPPPPPPDTNTATQWPLYSLYPPGPEWPFSRAVPTSQEPSKGYDVTVSKLDRDRRSAMYNQANGQLLDGPGGYTFSLFVQNFNLDMSLAGSHAQSQYTRDFYARNFVQPSIIITGQSPTQEDYGILCEFVHSCQHKAVANGYQNLTQLYVSGRQTANGFDGRGYDGKRTDGTRVMVDRPGTIMPGHRADPQGAPAGTYYSQHIRGAHQPLLAKGYISSMRRIHRQFEYAVRWTMTFTIAAMLHGPFRDSVQSLPHQSPTTWLNMLQDIQKTGVVSNNTPGLAHQNATIVRAASTATINPLTPAFATTNNTGGTGSNQNNNTTGGSWQPALLTWYDPALGGTNSGTGAADPNAPTASGEPYDPTADTCAADPKYAFGTMVAFQYNGKTVTCKVNDRGGAITGSHFDLSVHAAAKLGMQNAGTVNAQFMVVTG